MSNGEPSGPGRGIPRGLCPPRSVQDALRMLEDLREEVHDFCLKGRRGYTNGLHPNLNTLRMLEDRENWLVAYIASGGESPGTTEKQRQRIEADRKFMESARYAEVSEGGLDNRIFHF